MSVSFVSHRISFVLKNKKIISRFIAEILRRERKKADTISFKFCSDAYLLALNKRFLKHNTLTDILTFQYSSEKLSGEIFISIPRVRENAKKFAMTFGHELHRVMIHGILHLCGYDDKTLAGKKKMRARENFYLLRIRK